MSPLEKPLAAAIAPGDGNPLSIVMHNIYPDGRKEPAVEASYERASRANSVDS